MAARVAELSGVLLLAAAVTAAIAITVLRAPSTRLFGMPIVGWHHDPFTVIAQFNGAPRAAMYSQPITDVAGSLIARVSGGVAAYNWLVLLSFPLAAGAAFLLARHAGLTFAAAALAAMAYAFSPFHVAHAAYHPHIAQVQWIPLYLLALWRCLDRATVGAMVFLAAAAAAVTLSNFYGGLIAAVITPPALIAYEFAAQRPAPREWRHLGLTVFTLAAVCAAGAAYVLINAPALVANRAAFAFPPADLVRYSATGWSFLVPPVAHPLLGDAAKRFWASAHVREGLLEQQVFLGWSLMALAIIAAAAWLMRRPETALVPALISVAAVALLFATWPPGWLYNALPMFRAYARFGVVVQLMTALAAGIGFDALRRSPRRPARALAIVLTAALVCEYAVSPLAMSRDVRDGPAIVAAASPPSVYTADIRGFAPREQDGRWSWRWMGEAASWTARNTTADPVAAFLEIELAAFHHERRLNVVLDGRTIASLDVSESRRSYQLGPMLLTPGDHTLAFDPLEPPSVADAVIHNGDRRALSIALGTWRWILERAP